MAPSPQAMRVCAKCGSIVPVESTGCKGCGLDPATVVLVDPSTDGTMFALVLESDFQCRGCGLRSALDSLYVDKEASCTRCGMNQLFDVSQWKDGLAHAHSVADLSGPPPEGQGFALHGKGLRAANPFAALGVRFTFAELTESGLTISAAGMVQKSLRVKVATGHPVCPEGHGPTRVELLEPGKVRVTCPTCQKPASYALPTAASELDSHCVGVIDDDHREDQKVVRMQPSAGGGGAVALTCPSCNASLPATPDSSLVTCQFCNTVSYLPRRALLKLHPQQKSKPFWLLFKGPSAKRTGATDDASDDDDEEEPSPKVSPPMAPTPATAGGSPGGAPTAFAAYPPAPSAPKPHGVLYLVVAAVVLAAVAVTTAILLLSGESKTKSAPAPHSAPAHKASGHH